MDADRTRRGIGLTSTLHDSFSEEEARAPRAIAARLLEDTGCGLMEDQFNLFRKCFALPTRIETFEAHHVLETEEDLRGLFDAVRHYHASLGITHLDRRILEAERSGPGRISYTHETRMLNKAYIVRATELGDED